MRILLMLLLLASCGGGNDYTPPYGAAVEGVVIWDASLEDRPVALAAYDETAACLKAEFGIEYTKRPHLRGMADIFRCGWSTYADGCTDFSAGVIYIYAPTPERERFLISHEAIHWIADVGNEAHDDELFTQCEALEN